MDELKICFPIVWNGLIFQRWNSLSWGDGGQVEAINKVFSAFLDSNAKSNDRPKVTTWVRGKRAISPQLSNSLFERELNDDVQAIADDIKDLGLKHIRETISAFHYYLSEHQISVGEFDKIAMEEALRQNNPELYIARALLAGLRYRKRQHGLTPEMLDELHDIEETTIYPDAFAEAQRAASKEKVEMRQTVYDVEDVELWQRVLDVQKENPGCFRQLTLDALRNMTMSDLKMFERACELIFRHFSRPGKRSPSNYPFIISVRDIGNSDINEYMTFFNDEGYIRLETLGLISHPRDFFLHTWGVTRYKTMSEGGFLADVALENCLLVQKTTEGKEYEYKLICYFLTDVGLEVYRYLAKHRKRGTADNDNSFYATLVAKTFQDVELQKENPSFKFEVYHLECLPPESPEEKGVRLEIDFAHDLLKEKTLIEFEEEGRYYKQFEEQYSEEHYEKKLYLNNKAKYHKYLEKFPELKDYEPVKKKPLPNSKVFGVTEDDEEDFTEPV